MTAVHRNLIFDALQLLLLVVAAILVVGQMYMPIPLLSDFHISYPDYDYPPAWVISSFGLAYAVGFLIFGPLSDYLERKLLLGIGLVLLALTSLLVAMSGGVNLLLARAAQGFIAASFPPVALAYISSQFSEPFKNWAISAIAIAFLSAVTFGQLITVAFSDGSLYHQQIFLSIVYIVLAFGLLVVLGSSSKNSMDGKKLTKPKLINLTSLLSNLMRRDLTYLYVIAFSVLFVYVGHYMVVSELFSSTGKQDLFLRLITLPFFLFGFLAPRLIKSGSDRALFYVYVTYLALFILNIVLNRFDLLLFNVVLLCAISAMTALIIPNLIASISSRATPHERGSALALYTFVLFVGASLAPIVFGYFIKTQQEVIEMFFAVVILSLNVLLLRCFGRGQDVKNTKLS